jgi:hypothetical protein
MCSFLAIDFVDVFLILSPGGMLGLRAHLISLKFRQSRQAYSFRKAYHSL